MFQTAFESFMRNFAFFAFAAGLLTALEVFGLDLGLGASIPFYGLIALFSHRMILLEETYGLLKNSKLPDGQKMPLLGFLWRYGLFLVCFIVVFVIILVPLMAGSQNDDIRTLLAVLIGLVFASPVLAILLSLVGTVLPAVAVGGDASWSAALRRGRRRFWATVLRLTFGPGLFTLLTVAAAIALASSPRLTGNLFVGSFLPYLAGLFSTHLTAAVLSLAYREAEATGV